MLRLTAALAILSFAPLAALEAQDTVLQPATTPVISPAQKLSPFVLRDPRLEPHPVSINPPRPLGG